MDHALYPYRPLPARPKLRWPGGKPLAFVPLLYVEHWELLAAEGTRRAPGVHGPWGNFAPDWRTYTYRLFGNRIGIWRVLEAFDRRGLKPTVALGAAAAELHPEIVAALCARGCEVAAHGTHATRIVSAGMTEAEERAFISDSVARVARATGTKPRGWIGQDFSESPRTAQIVADLGLDWIADWPNDEQPYALATTPPILSLPVLAELDDVQMLWMKQVPSWEYPALVGEAAECLTRDGAAQARALLLGIRPWLSGQPHRIGHLEAGLDRILATDPWCASASAVADAARAISC